MFSGRVLSSYQFIVYDDVSCKHTVVNGIIGYMVSRLSNEAVEFIVYVIIQVYAKVSTCNLITCPFIGRFSVSIIYEATIKHVFLLTFTHQSSGNRNKNFALRMLYNSCTAVMFLILTGTIRWMVIFNFLNFPIAVFDHKLKRARPL